MAVAEKEIFRGGRNQLRETAKNIRKREFKQKKDKKESPIKNDNGGNGSSPHNEMEQVSNEQLVNDLLSLKGVVIDEIPAEPEVAKEELAREPITVIEASHANKESEDNGKKAKKEAVSFLNKEMAKILQERIENEGVKNVTSRPFRSPDVYYMASIAGKDIIGEGNILRKTVESRHIGKDPSLSNEDMDNIKDSISKADLDALAFGVFVRNKADAEMARKKVPAGIRSDLSQKLLQEIADTSNVGKDFLARRKGKPDARLDLLEIGEIETLIDRKITEALPSDEPARIRVSRKKVSVPAKLGPKEMQSREEAQVPAKKPSEEVAPKGTAAGAVEILDKFPENKKMRLVGSDENAQPEEVTAAVGEKAETGPEKSASAKEIPAEAKIEKPAEAEQEDIREKELRASLDEARNLYATTEFRDVTTMQRIRKLLGVSPKDNQENNNVASARTAYENSLRALKDYQLSRLQNSNPTGEAVRTELKEMVSYYNYVEAKNFYDARTDAKMAFLAETENKSSVKKTWDQVRLKSAQVSEWYNKKVPTYVKTGLIVASFIPGAEAFRLGKRTWGAFMMVAAGGMQIDKLAQFKDNLSNKMESTKVIDRSINVDVDFEYLNGVLEEKIAGMDKKLNQHAMRSQVNKFIAFSSAMFLGVTAAKGIMDLAQEHAIASTALAANVVPAVHVESLTIGDNSNIEKTLIDHIKLTHPEIKDPGYAAHQMFRDYMNDNKDQIVKNVGEVEYGKILKDGMVNVKAGTGLNLVLDEHNKLVLHDIDGKISHIDNSESIPEIPAPAVAEPAPDDFDVDVAATKGEVQSQINDLEQQREVLEKEIPIRQHEYDIDKASEHDYRPNGITQMDDWKTHDALKDAETNLDVTHSKLHELLAEKGILDSPDVKTNAISLKNFIFGDNAEGKKIFQQLKDEKIFDIFKSEELKKEFLGKFPKGTTAGLEKIIKEIPPKSGDTVRKWIVRVILESAKAKG